MFESNAESPLACLFVFLFVFVPFYSFLVVLRWCGKSSNGVEKALTNYLLKKNIKFLFKRKQPGMITTFGFYLRNNSALVYFKEDLSIVHSSLNYIVMYCVNLVAAGKKLLQPNRLQIPCSE